MAVNVQGSKLEKFKIIIIGRIKAISTSKIKKIIAIKKNRREKGRREDLFGSNPHSNGELFSRSFDAFFDSKEAKIITIKAIIKIIKLIIKEENIIYTKNFRPCNWKSHILLYYINKILTTSSVNRHI